MVTMLPRSVYLLPPRRDAPHAKRIREPTHLQSVPIPVRQLLLVDYLHRFREGQVSRRRRRRNSALTS